MTRTKENKFGQCEFVSFVFDLHIVNLICFFSLALCPLCLTFQKRNKNAKKGKVGIKVKPRAHRGIFSFLRFFFLFAEIGTK